MRIRSTLAGAILGLAVLTRASGLAQDVVNLELESDDAPPPSEKQAALSGAKERGVYRLRVRYVKVEGRWGERVQLPLVPGEILTPEKISASMDALRALITKPAAPILALRSKGEVGVLYIDVKFDTDPAIDANGNAQRADDTVGVIFRPHYLHVSLVEIGNNILPIPRTGRPTFYEQAPRWLLALNPTAGLSYDRIFGSAVSLGLATGLFDYLPETDERQHLDLSVAGTKSFEESFYRADAALRYAYRQDAGVLREMSLATDFAGTDEPLGVNEHTRVAGGVTFGVKLKIAPNTRLAIDAGYRRTDDRLRNVLGTFVDASANQEVNRVLFDTIPPQVNGFLRAAIWEENSWQTNGDRSYQRIVGRVGYEKEISVAQNQTIGVEIIAGAGHASAATPAYAQFFGGNPPGQFLYDGSDAASLRNLPDGPILRSFGENEARLTGGGRLTSGGNTFWHVNLNVTIPIRPLSRSLIPNELTDIEGPDGPLSIKRILKRQINVTGPSMLRAVLKNEGMSDAEAERQARKVFQEITPATNFIIEDANVFSLKPLLMFDAAGLSDRHGRSETWLAAGGGLQLTVVTAKLEAGYMHTISGPQQGHGGNAFVRLVFQNLF